MDAIKMKSTQQGSPTGATVETFEEGETYVIGETITASLAQSFFEAKWASKTKVKSAEEIAADKAAAEKATAEKAAAEKAAAEKAAADKAAADKAAADKAAADKAAADKAAAEKDGGK